MLRYPKHLVKIVLNRYPEYLCKHEFETQSFRRFNERPIEFGFVFRILGEIYPRTILDVGTGRTALPHLMRNCGFLVTASDNVRDFWPSGMFNRHYHVIDDDITATQLSGRFDLITCISVLEHIEKPDDAMRNMLSLLNPNGHLVLTCPYNETEYVRNVYELPGASLGKGAPYITTSYSRTELTRWIDESQATIVEQEYWRFWDGKHWNVGKPLIPPKRVTVEEKHQHTCILIRRG